MVSLKPLIACTAAIAPFCSASAAKPRILEAVVETDVVRPPYVSGVMAVWTKLFVRDTSGQRRVLYLPYMDVQQPLPRQGQRCSVRYHIGSVKGWVVRTSTYRRRAPVIDQLNC